MKIGVLTYNDINNYGAQLQAASVPRFMISRGRDAELMGFRTWRHEMRRNITLRLAIKKLSASKFKGHFATSRSLRTSICDITAVFSGEHEAIVVTGTVVAKNVPHAIVGGNPAQLTRMRFDEAEINSQGRKFNPLPADNPCMEF